MVEKDDGRLFMAEDWMYDFTWRHRRWVLSNPEWDHDHCRLCWAKISEYDDTLHEGYTAEDEKCWICSECYNEFKEMFRWKSINELK